MTYNVNGKKRAGPLSTEREKWDVTFEGDGRALLVVETSVEATIAKADRKGISEARAIALLHYLAKRFPLRDEKIENQKDT